MQIIQAANGCGRFYRLGALRELLGKLLAGTKRIKRVARNRAIQKEDGTKEYGLRETPPRRLVVCAHMGSRGHSGKVSALHVLRPYCMWDSMEADVGDLAVSTLRG